MQVPYENRVCYLLLFEVREINRFLEICHRDSRKILRASRYSILETRASNLDTRFSIASRIEDRVSSRDCQLTFARYCMLANFACYNIFPPEGFSIGNQSSVAVNSQLCFPAASQTQLTSGTEGRRELVF